MTKKVIAISLFLFLSVILLSPARVSAVNIWQGATCGGSAPIGPDGGPTGPCSLCDAMIVGRNIITFLFEFSMMLGTIMVAWGGIKMMIAGGDPKKISDAKQIMTSAIIGIVIAVSAWTIVNTVLAALSPTGIAPPWSKITCQ